MGLSVVQVGKDSSLRPMLYCAMLIYLVLGTVNLTTTCMLFDLLNYNILISLRCDLETTEWSVRSSFSRHLSLGVLKGG